MGEIGRWNRHRFVISADVLRGFNNLNITAGSETEDKESDKQKYVSFKNSKPTQITIDVNLSAQLGCDVRAEAMGMADDASKGVSDYFYVGKEKLVTCKLMLTDASVTEVGITYDGSWTQATVRLTFKQSTKADGSLAAAASGGSAKDKNKILTEGIKKTTHIDVYPVVQTVVDYYYATEEEKKALQTRQIVNGILNKAKATSATSETAQTTIGPAASGNQKIVKYTKIN